MHHESIAPQDTLPIFEQSLRVEALGSATSVQNLEFFLHNFGPQTTHQAISNNHHVQEHLLSNFVFLLVFLYVQNIAEDENPPQREYQEILLHDSFEA